VLTLGETPGAIIHASYGFAFTICLKGINFRRVGGSRDANIRKVGGDNYLEKEFVNFLTIQDLHAPAYNMFKGQFSLTCGTGQAQISMNKYEK
jgi:hypothetical protein